MSGALQSSSATVKPRQLTLNDHLDSLARFARAHDPRGPATALFCIVLALMGIGLAVQASHASTIMAPEEFHGQLASQMWFRAGGLIALILFSRIGPSGVRRYIPALCVVMTILLIAALLPGIGGAINGSRRWLNLGFFKFQPSELARIVVVLWAAHKCVTLGPLVSDFKRGVLPMLAVGMWFFVLVAVEPDFGGSLLLFVCLLATMWVGGARLNHVSAFLGSVGTVALVLGWFFVPHVHRRIEMFLGHRTSDQVTGAVQAMTNGGLFGTGVANGDARNLGVPYLESDFAFAQVGEEFGWLGVLLVIGLLLAFMWQSLRLVYSIRDRYEAIATFGLLISTVFQALLHIQVVADVVPPKGMTLPFISHGGTSLIVACIGVGLAIGAARNSAADVAPELASGVPGGVRP
ncbi:MAG: FtsW/RodA/SpoVE family cell cycle protein [Planctomycetes bacterium]|nr:FtsW/RodA/SpoVE family cell cycle protein [Planctomycetota bacterium]